MNDQWVCQHCLRLVDESDLGGKNDEGVGHPIGDEPPSWCGPCVLLDAEELASLLDELRSTRRALRGARHLKHDWTEYAAKNPNCLTPAQACEVERGQVLQQLANKNHQRALDAEGKLEAAVKHITILRAQRDEWPQRVAALPWGRWASELGVGNVDHIKQEVMYLCAAESSNAR